MRGPQTAGAGRPPPCRCPVPGARIRPAAGERGAGRRAARTRGRRAGRSFLEKAPPHRRAPGVGRAPAGRMGGAPTKSGGRGTRTAPRVPASGSGFDKLNLRVLEKLQEEESKECGDWLEGALSPRELRPPRARAGPAPPSARPAGGGGAGQGHPVPRSSRVPRPRGSPIGPRGPHPTRPHLPAPPPGPGRGPRPRPR